MIPLRDSPQSPRPRKVAAYTAATVEVTGADIFYLGVVLAVAWWAYHFLKGFI